MASSGSNGRGKRGGAGGATRLAFTIPSVWSHGHEVQKQIMQAVESGGFNYDCIFAIKLALEEALINAIKHGNKEDPAKTVKVEAKISHERAEIMIEDEGGGFERCNVPDPRLDENLEKCSGRGILLIEFYMNEAKWTNGGRRLRMVKKNESTPACTK
jgi:serine/threonine-protein kinase RsbW